jgi:hypothetical protein
MALVLKDRVLETSQTSGTGTLTLAGAVIDFQSFSSAIGNGNTTYYTIADDADNQWEVGIGTVGAGTLTRDTVLSSSNSGAKVNFGASIKNVFCDYPASKSVYQDENGLVTVPNLATNSASSLTPVLSYNASNSAQTNGATVANSYLQNVMQNKSGTAGASTNFAVSNDLGTDSTYYGEFGMNSSVFSSGTPSDYFSLNNGIYYSGHDGDITYGSGNGYKIFLAWGTTGQSAHVINASGAIGLNTNITGTTNFGTAGYILTSGGSSATPTWTNPTSIVGGAGGSNTQVQYNNAGVLAGSANMTFNGTTFTTANDASISGLTVGKGAGAVASNTVLGASAFGSNVSGASNVAIGQQALRLTTSSNNTAIGYQAGYANTTGVGLTAIGQGALYSSTGNYNTAIGQNAGTTTNTGSGNFFGGVNAGKFNTTGSNNTVLGGLTGALAATFENNTTGSTNTAIGSGSLFSNTTASSNTAVGYQAGYSNTTGIGVTVMGYKAGFAGVTANSITAFGYNALAASTGTGNSAFGAEVLLLNTTGTNNAAFGGNDFASYHPTLKNNTTGSNNSAFGFGALGANSTGGNNTAVGYQAAYGNSTGVSITAVGYQAARNTTASNNTAIGPIVLFENTTGTGNTAVGGHISGSTFSTMQSNTTGSSNTALGISALAQNTTASNNTAVGYQAGYSNTTGTNLTAIGYQANYSNTTGASNTGVGWGAINSNSTGSRNTALGQQAVYVGTVSDNTGIGYQALASTTTGASNTALGSQALVSNTTASNNTAVGYQAGYSGTTANSNVLLGYRAGYNIVGGSAFTCLGFNSGGTIGNGTGNYGTYLGYQAVGSGNNASSEIVVCAGTGSTGKGASTGFIDPNSGGVYQGNNSAAWSITSDKRLKKNIVNNKIGLNAISQIQVRNFEYRTANEITELEPQNAINIKGVQLGAIAQELQAILPDCVKTESTGVMSVDTTNLTWYLINAVKELNAEVQSLKQQLGK